MQQNKNLEKSPAHSSLYLYLKSIILGLIDFEQTLDLVEFVGPSSTIILELEVDDRDAGKVLGRGGENIAAIRRLLYAHARKVKVGTVILNILNTKKKE